MLRRSKRQSGRPATPPQELVQQCCICLEEPRALAWLDACDHRFCFACIREWSGKSNTCPLCKTAFHRISSRARKLEVETPSPSSDSYVGGSGSEYESDFESSASEYELLDDSDWDPEEAELSESDLSCAESCTYSSE